MVYVSVSLMRRASSQKVLKMSEQADRRVLVMGCGGIGGVIAAKLIKAGCQVTAITHNPTIASALKAQGLEAIYEDGPLRVELEVYAQADELDPARRFELAVLAVPPDAALAAAKAASPLLAPGGVMVCCPNGLVEERLAKEIPEAQILGGVVGFGAERVAQGIVRQTSPGGFVLGRINPFAEGVEDQGLALAASILSAVGPIQLSDNLRGARWSKLAINCAISSLGTIGGDRLGALLRYRFVRRLALEVMTEVVMIAKAEGVRLEKVSGTLNLDWMALDERERQRPASTGLFARHSVLLAVGTKFRNMRSSMLAALERGRMPPVDFLNGEITSRAAEHGLEVPVNAAILALVHQLARKEQRSSIQTLRALYDQTRDAAQGAQAQRDVA